MTKTAHTPTPWAFTADEIYYDDKDVYPRIAFVDMDNTSTERAQADAAFIVRAVNAHDALVESLGTLLNHYTEMVNSGDCGNWDPEGDVPVIAARAALTLAKGV